MDRQVAIAYGEISVQRSSVAELTARLEDAVAAYRAALEERTRERVPLDWAALIRNTLARFETRFRDAGLRVVWREVADGAMIRADGRRMEQVLDNLLVNELRYVPSGGTVELTIGRSPDTPGRLRLEVSDDGPGLQPEERARVFERFYRSGGQRDDGGSGLGLAIVREIVERHGGSIRAEAHAPRGLSIVLELPSLDREAGPGGSGRST
jgi:two-component system sensor histidine kinase BaeS